MSSIMDEFWDALSRDLPSKATSMVEQGYVNALTKDPKGVPVLMIACALGYSDLVQALLAKGAVADERNKDDQGPLFVACMTGKAASVRHLLKAGVSPSAPFCGDEKVPPIVAAASRGHLSVIHELLNWGAQLDETDAQGHTALHTACFTGSPHVAIFLVERGANFNLRSKKGALPITWAASKGHTDVVKALLDKGADPNGAGGVGEVVARSEIDLMPLHAAARANRVDCVKLLLDRGAQIDLRAPWNKNETPLHCAAMGDAKDACLVLLKRGADFGAKDSELKTVIEKGSAAGAVATVELLVSWERYGGEAPPEEKTVEEPSKWQPDFSKIDPLYFKLASWMGEGSALVTAATKNELSVCRALLEQGADPNCSMKMSPLAAACKEGHARIAKLLIMTGADTTKQSNKRTPLEWAREEGARDPYEDDLQQEADAVLKAAAERTVVIDNGGGSKTIINANGEVQSTPDALAPRRPVKEPVRESMDQRRARYAETVAVLEDPNYCGSCGLRFPAADLKRCGKCKLLRFCSTECQKKAWLHFHREQCNTWAERKDMMLRRPSKRKDGEPKKE